jgi:hypothetical protein
MHACVVGFNDKTERLRFKTKWKLNNQQRKNMPLTNDGCVDVGINMIAEKNLNGRLQGVPPLQMVQPDAIVTAPSDDSHDQQRMQLFLRAR